MKNLSLTVILFLFCITTFISCGEDSIFSSKVKTANGVLTVSGIRPGGLEKAMLLYSWSVTKLAIDGTIDSRDFATMRDQMPKLSVLDLSNATIVAYNGFEGTGGTKIYYYTANAIPEFAFYNPTTGISKKSLTSIKFPTSIKSIKDYAFDGCSGLTGTLIIPASVRDTIGKSTFAYCEGLTGLTLAATKCINESAFQGCKNLSGTLVIPDSTFIIKPWAFAYCSKLDSISISATVEDIGVAAFNQSGTLFVVNNLNAVYSSLNDVLYTVDQSTLVQFPKSKTGNYDIPSTVIVIGAYSFANCIGLTSVTIPSSVTTIEKYAFSGCTELTGAFPISSRLSSIEQYVFDDCTKITSFAIAPDNTTYSFSNGVLIDLGQQTIKRCLFSKIGTYVIPSDITFIDNSAFSNCTSLTSVTLPKDLISIGERSFFNCSGLTSIYVNTATPLDMSSSATAFDGVYKTQCTLHVPVGTKANYQDANIWKNFVNIVEN